MIYSSSNELRMQLQMPLYNLNVFAALSSYYRLQPPTFSLEKKQKKQTPWCCCVFEYFPAQANETIIATWHLLNTSVAV